ncbi:MAG: glutamate--tRNA ligase [Deltaproteobacteria bacterium RBG_19FT_COMBO_43_11]|nr:MAG: glutamate--tRNA ligase [Deltaproteobacteria bacterium RBG_19FT_COMBO_43_11]
MIKKPRVRFAPSPTGELHVGNARTALFNWMFARHFGGDFILRIEDTDESRSALSYQLNLYEDLKWLGLDWEEGPYKQSERLEIYKSHLQKLVEKDLVYPCYCTQEELEDERQALILSKRMPRYMGKCRNLTLEQRKQREKEGRWPSFRFKAQPQVIEFEDVIRGAMKFEGEAIGDFIIMRSNGMPAYNFAVVIDDYLMKITHVIRGEDHLSNTALQLMLYKALEYEPPIFAHHSLILGKDRSKLSKRHGSISVGEFRKQGILPEALMNYLGLLGSSFTEGREVLSREEMIKDFSLERSSKSGAIFDEEKLHWLNGIYIRNCKTEDLIERLKPFLQQTGYKTEALDAKWFNRVIELVKAELTTLSEIGSHVDIFFNGKYEITDEARKTLSNEKARKVIVAFNEYLKTSKDNLEELYTTTIKHVKEKTGAKGKELFMPIRAALTGKTHGPELDKVFAILGKEAALKRLKPFNS